MGILCYRMEMILGKQMRTMCSIRWQSEKLYACYFDLLMFNQNISTELEGYQYSTKFLHSLKGLEDKCVYRHSDGPYSLMTIGLNADWKVHSVEILISFFHVQLYWTYAEILGFRLKRLSGLSESQFYSKEAMTIGGLEAKCTTRYQEYACIPQIHLYWCRRLNMYGIQ